MFRRRMILSIVSVLGFTLGFSDTDPFENANKLKQKLENERTQAQKLEQQKKQLESLISSEKGQLKKYDKILRNYQYNLAEAQKVIDAAEKEYLKILERNEQREAFFAQCTKLVEEQALMRCSTNYEGDPQARLVEDASQLLAMKMFQLVQSEQPRIKELQSLIQEKRMKQERILTKYMPVDLEAKNHKEEWINEKEQQIAQTESAYLSKIRQVEQLQEQLKAWEQRIAEINRQRRLEEQRKRKEEEKRRQQLLAQQQKQAQEEMKSPTVETSSNRELFTQTYDPNKPFADLRNKLPWPAKGEVIRPFGEFTHPDFKVTIKSPGIDVRVNAGTSLRAVASGEVVLSGEIPGFGRTVILAHDRNYMTVYGNITEKVSEGNRIQAGDVIGTVISHNLNNSSNYHFEIRRGQQALNPQLWLTQ